MTAVDDMLAEYISPSDAENDVAGRQMLVAAFEALGDLNAQSDSDLMVRRLLNAAKAVHETESRLNQEFRKLHPGKKTHSYYFQAIRVVASAFDVQMSGGFIGPDDCHPNSYAGSAYVVFARVAAALHEASSIAFLLNDPDEPIYGDETAINLLASLKEPA